MAAARAAFKLPAKPDHLAGKLHIDDSAAGFLKWEFFLRY